MNQLISSLLKILTVLFVITLWGCEKGNPLEPQTEQLYKFRFEISTEKPELYNVKWEGGNYFDGAGRVVSFIESETVPSPCIKEVEIPRNFMNMTALSFSSIIEYDVGESPEGVLIGKLFVNDKLLYSYTAETIWSVSISYNRSTKKYTLENSLKEKIEFDKID